MLMIDDYLKSIAYGGRGILLGMTADASSMVAAYFIMGRSENSRNRVFEQENKAVKIRAFDESKLKNPSLVVYYPVKVCGNMMIVTNGDQTDTIYENIRYGHSFEDALRTRSYEEDPPLLTPRISGLLDLADGSYRLSILKSDGLDGNNCNRYFYEYTATPGVARYISTYQGDNNNPLAFSGEPLVMELDYDIETLTNHIWESLNEDNKVALFVRYIDCVTKEYSTSIVNKYL